MIPPFHSHLKAIHDQFSLDLQCAEGVHITFLTCTLVSGSFVSGSDGVEVEVAGVAETQGGERPSPPFGSHLLQLHAWNLGAGSFGAHVHKCVNSKY